MKIRRRPLPLLLFLLPAIASVATAGVPKDAKLQLANDAREAKLDITMTSSLAPKATTVGTKDAPVDGKDGKPKIGPFVGADQDDHKKQKPEAEDEQLVTKKPSKTKESTTVDGKPIPEVNDGVMNDPTREKPKKGTTGTEGGVSEKVTAQKAHEGQTGEKAEKKPASPKEAPPLPHSEQEKIDQKDKDLKKDKDGVKATDETSGLGKPNDLPNKPHDLPQPVPDSANKDHLDVTKPSTKKPTSPSTGDDESEGLIQPLHSYLLSLTMILFSEIGDKTFLIAALMAMKHDRILVFSAALSALIFMTVLSAVLGHAVPTLLPKRFTNFAAAILFLVFGGKMLREGLAMSKDEGVAAEMQEVEMELEEKEHQLTRQLSGSRASASPYALESGLGGGFRSHGSRKSRSTSRLPSPPRSPSFSPPGLRSPSPSPTTVKGAIAGLQNLLSLLLSPAWVQTFVMTFLGEWGDRSQIATIAMAAGQDYWWVTGGAVSGHAVCTGVAVLGGRAIAGRVSLRVVTLGGAGAFLVFGVIYLVEAVYYA